MNRHPTQIQTGTLQGLPEVLNDFHVDPDAFLRPFGLAVPDLSMRNRFIPYDDYVEILQRAAATCRAPHLGFLLNQARTHGLFADEILGLLLKHCAEFGEVLRAIVRYYRAVSGGATYTLRREGRAEYFTRSATSATQAHNRILQDVSLLDFHTVFQKVLGPDWCAEGLYFSYPPPEDQTPYTSLSPCPVIFSSTFQAIRFSSRDLERPLDLSQDVLEALLRTQADRQRVQHEISTTAATIHSIDVLLPTGVCCAESVAAAFDIHSRSLHRKLAAEGTRFATLLRERRDHLACAYLENTTLSIRDISNALGYAAPEVFVRAFRGWHGMTPGAWRSQQTPSFPAT